MRETMKNKLYTVKEYALKEGIGVAGVYLRIKRETLLKITQHGVILVFAESDKTIKKPRKN